MGGIRVSAQIAAVLFLSSAHAASSAAPAPSSIECKTLGNRANLGPIEVVIQDDGTSSLKVSIGGYLQIKDAAELPNLRSVTPSDICEASLGAGILLNEEPFCDLFTMKYADDDVIRFADKKIEFLIKNTQYFDGTIELSRADASTACSDQVSFLIKTGEGRRISGVDALPDVLTKKEAVFVPTDWRDGAGFDWSFMTESETPTDDTSDSDTPSEFTWFHDNEAGKILVQFFREYLALFVSVFAFWFVLRKILRVDHLEEADRRWLDLLYAAVALYATDRLYILVYWTYFALGGTQSNFPIFGPLFAIDPTNRIAIPIGYLFLLVIYCVVTGYVWQKDRLSPPVFLGRAATLSFGLAAVFGYGHEYWETVAPFDARQAGLAWILSLTAAATAMVALRRTLKISLVVAFGVAIILACSVLGPSQSLDYGSVSEDWFYLLFPLAAGALYQAAILVFAFGIVRRGRRGQTKPRQRNLVVLGCLAMSVVGFTLKDIPNAAAVMGAALLAGLTIFKPDSTGPATSGQSESAKNKEGIESLSLRGPAFLAGGVATIIFWAHVLGASGTSSGMVAFDYTDVFTSFGVFSTTTIAALLLGTGFTQLRGDSAVLKSMLIVFTILGFNFCRHATDIVRDHQMLPFVTEYLSTTAALLVIAVVAFDYSEAKRKFANFTPWDTFKGTTLERALPVLWGLGAALFSIVTPIFNEEIKTAFREMLQAAIPEVHSPKDAEARTAREATSENVADDQQ